MEWVGHSKEDKAVSHDRIVEIASARMRESGTTTPGVAQIMKAAGLTHGGFYKHFESRDDLVAEAVGKAFDDSDRAMESLTEDADDPLAAFVDWYASAAHCEDPATGCAIVALGADIARGDERVRTAYREQVEKYLASLERLLGGDADARRRATVALSSLVGAVLVARTVDDDALSEELLRNVRESVKSSYVAKLGFSPAMAILTEDMKRVVREQRLGFYATVCEDGSPNLSPKGTTYVWDDDHLFFADIRSPQTVENVRRGSLVEVNIVDPFVRKGYRFKGPAAVREPGADDYARGLEILREAGSKSLDRIRAIVVIEVREARPVISPSYDDGKTSEAEIVRVFQARYAALHSP